MNSETYKLNEETNSLVEQPEMKKPANDMNFREMGHYLDAKAKYNNHLLSLKTIPISGIVPPEWKGKELIKDVHFKVEAIVNLNSAFPNLVAIPIVQPKEVEVNEDELWIELRKIIDSNLIRDIVSQPSMNELKRHFTIQRKK